MPAKAGREDVEPQARVPDGLWIHQMSETVVWFSLRIL